MKKGVTVLYNKFGIGCVDIEMGGETYILIREEDLIGTFPGSGATANDIPKLTPLGDRVMLKTDTVSTTNASCPGQSLQTRICILLRCVTKKIVQAPKIAMS